MIVERAAESTPMIEVKLAIDKAETALRELRLRSSAKLLAALNRMTSAEIEGWAVDVDDTVRSLNARLSIDRGGVRKAKDALRAAVARAVTARVPGSNTLAGNVAKIYEVADEWTNDLEDYLHEFQQMQRRMRAYRKSPGLMTRAEKAYQDALQKVLNLESEPTVSCDESGDDMVLRLVATIPAGLYDNPEELLRMERSVHEEVAKQDDKLVGRIALTYAVAA